MHIMPSLDVCHAVIPKKKKKFKSGMWWIIIVWEPGYQTLCPGPVIFLSLKLSAQLRNEPTSP